MRNCLLILLCLTGLLASAQNPNTLGRKAYLSGTAEDWATAIEAAHAIPDPATSLITIARFHQGAAYAAMAFKQDEAFDEHLDGMEASIDALWEITETSAAGHGLYSALLGLKIARKPMLGMIHGSRASSYAKEALELDATDPIALYNAAGNLFYTPEQWGGDKAKAIKLLNAALANTSEEGKLDYNYLAVMAMLGEAYMQTGDYPAARLVFEKALSEAPDYSYVEQILLPRLAEKEGR